MVSVDGFFEDANGDMSWAFKDDPEWKAFVAENAEGGSALIFGRVTYDPMTRFWPTPLAMKMNPAVAERMNNLPKVVFSKTMDAPTWKNTKLVKSNIATEIQAMKNEPGGLMTILGSGSIISQSAEAGFIDQFQIVVNPIVLGKGQSVFEGVKARLNLKRSSTRA